ncbi:MAG TPA: DUF262 domain-containing protein [Kofleriaceae bacterium]|nr:DUF262 domain-containing protein [Kofleriaceae bacterium]
MRGPAQTSEPIIQYLYQLIDSISEGKLLIPRFQRPLVWEWDRQAELLRSVKDGIPMGAIMVWRTARKRIRWQEELAGHKLPKPPDSQPHEYLLDGLQRLSTMFAALRGFGKGSEEPARPSIGYDLEEEAFVESFDPSTQPQVVPLSALPDSLTLLRFQRKLPKGERSDTWVKRSDALAKAFREYKVPVIPIVSEEFDVAARTFNLLNSQGMRMGEADMIHALTWSPKFELRDKLESLRNELLQPLGWEDIEFENILKVVKAEADLDVYEESVEQVSKLLKDDPEALDRAFDHLVQVATLLREKCGIRSWGLVPYSHQAILMADAIRLAPTKKRTRRVLSDWFWITTYGEMFAGLSGHRINLAIRDLRAAVRDGNIHWSGASNFRVRPVPVIADFRAVRMKAIALMLARNIEPSDRSAPHPFETLASYGRHAMVALVPRKLLSKTNSSSPANRFLCDPDDVAQLRQRVLNGQLSAQEQAEQLISNAALELIHAENWDAFVEARLETIIEYEERFVAEITGRYDLDGPAKKRKSRVEDDE